MGMNKIMNMCLAIALCLCATACGQSNPNQSSNSEPSSSSEPSIRSCQSENPNSSAGLGSDSIETENTEPLESNSVDNVKSGGVTLEGLSEAVVSGATLQEPPKMVVSTVNNVDSVIASCGNYQWNKEMSNGTTSSVIACGAHPLDEVNERAILYTAFPSGSQQPLIQDQEPGAMLPVFQLDFGDVPPEVVTAHRWPSAYIGHASEYANDCEEVMVDISDGITLFPPDDGEFVYEVYAVWGEVGSAYYVFDTTPQIRDGH